MSGRNLVRKRGVVFLRGGNTPMDTMIKQNDTLNVAQ